MKKFVPFSGAYPTADIQFLLNKIDMEMTDVEAKEALIQSGKRHYSEMLSQENPPTRQHLDIFAKAMDQHAGRMAKETVMLAKALCDEFGDTPVVLVSLVRAGAPLGVMLQRALRHMGKESYHYGVSIIRDRNLDPAAMDYIEKKHGTEGIVFVDGWTGKGAITGELIKSLKEREGYPAYPRLVVLADPCGCAWLSASTDDWLIPFGIMGAPVSGMVSRSVWADDDFHGCVYCGHLQEFECGNLLVDTVENLMKELDFNEIPSAKSVHKGNAPLRAMSKHVVETLVEKYDVNSTNRIKPGIAEATRAVLRRVPDHVLVQSAQDPDVALLVHLAKEKGITVTEVGDEIGQYRAVTIIKKVL
ncbi:cysteine protease StiP family protein [Aeromonas media]|uniref:cysteine protease StiP family protein n=1 Tax=Aeromonas media TaxID=651 RepID=UPI003D1EEE25